MRGKISERGSVLLFEMLIVTSILGVLLVMSAPSFMHLRMSQQANQALSTLRAIQNAEAYYLQIYHNGYADPGVLAGTGIAVPATCDAPLLLGGAQAQTQTNGYFFQFTPGPAPAVGVLGSRSRRAGVAPASPGSPALDSGRPPDDCQVGVDGAAGAAGKASRRIALIAARATGFRRTA